MTAAEKIDFLLQRRIAEERCWRSLETRYLKPLEMFGPPNPWPWEWPGFEAKPQHYDCRVTYKWNQQYETLTAAGRSWRSAV